MLTLKHVITRPLPTCWSLPTWNKPTVIPARVLIWTIIKGTLFYGDSRQSCEPHHIQSVHVTFPAVAFRTISTLFDYSSNRRALTEPTTTRDSGSYVFSMHNQDNVGYLY